MRVGVIYPDQIFPIALATGLSVITVIIGLIVVPASVAFMMRAPQQRDALLICIGYVLLSYIFLLTVPAISTFSIEMDFRYLLQIYPFIILGSAITADLLLNQQKLYAPILGLFVIGLLSIAAARSSRAAALQLLGRSYSSDSCTSRMALLNGLRRISISQSSAGILTNSQGIVWYAMRVAAVPLTRAALQDAPIGTIVIFVRPGNTCADVVEAKDFSEIALTHGSDVGIIFSTDRLLIGRKQ